MQRDKRAEDSGGGRWAGGQVEQAAAAGKEEEAEARAVVLWQSQFDSLISSLAWLIENVINARIA